MLETLFDTVVKVADADADGFVIKRAIATELLTTIEAVSSEGHQA